MDTHHAREIKNGPGFEGECCQVTRCVLSKSELKRIAARENKN